MATMSGASDMSSLTMLPLKHHAISAVLHDVVPQLSLTFRILVAAAIACFTFITVAFGIRKNCGSKPSLPKGPRGLPILGTSI